MAEVFVFDSERLLDVESLLRPHSIGREHAHVTTVSYQSKLSDVETLDEARTLINGERCSRHRVFSVVALSSKPFMECAWYIDFNRTGLVLG